jgi:hypothetical protein
MDFSVSRIEGNRFYPALKSVAEASTRAHNANSYSCVYQPGNGTRYEVVFSEFNNGNGPEIVMTIVNMRKAMIIPSQMGMHSLGYMQEKLGLGEGDCYALIPLINDFLEEQGS